MVARKLMELIKPCLGQSADPHRFQTRTISVLHNMAQNLAWTSHLGEDYHSPPRAQSDSSSLARQACRRRWLGSQSSKTNQ
jgi:hypothetical protein